MGLSRRSFDSQVAKCQAPSETVGDCNSRLSCTVRYCAFDQIESVRLESVIIILALIGSVHPSSLNHQAGGSLFPPPTPAHLMRPECEDGTTVPIFQTTESPILHYSLIRANYLHDKNTVFSSPLNLPSHSVFPQLTIRIYTGMQAPSITAF